MKPRVTDWIDGSVKPTLPGVYETWPSENTTFQYWNGMQWGFCARNPDAAMCWEGFYSHYQSPRWRGLAKDPDRAAKAASQDTNGGAACD